MRASFAPRCSVVIHAQRTRTARMHTSFGRRATAICGGGWGVALDLSASKTSVGNTPLVCVCVMGEVPDRKLPGTRKRACETGSAACHPLPQPVDLHPMAKLPSPFSVVLFNACSSLRLRLRLRHSSQLFSGPLPRPSSLLSWRGSAAHTSRSGKTTEGATAIAEGRQLSCKMRGVALNAGR